MTRTSFFGTVALGLAMLGALVGRSFARVPVTASAPSVPGASVIACGTWGNGLAMLGDWSRMGQGMMGAQGHPGTQGLNGGMWGMMGGLGMMGFAPADAAPIPAADAERRLASFAASCGSDIRVVGLMPFASAVYAQLTDGAGTRLGEVLVDRYTGTVVPEPGPNLLWNARWGVAAGTVSTPRYDESAARRLAATFLAGYLPGAAVLTGAALPGYYTFAYGREQTIEGLLSVNAMTGVVWAHVWVGPVLRGAH